MSRPSKKRLWDAIRKVDILWPDPKVTTVMDWHNSNRTRPLAVDPTVSATTTLHSFEDPWPVGIGGANFDGDSAGTATSTYFKGRAWYTTQDATEANRDHLNEILRPLDAIEDQKTTTGGVSGGTGTSKHTRSGDVIKVFGVRCKVSWKPNWAADEVTVRDFNPTTAPRLKLMWVHLKNRPRVIELVRKSLVTDVAPSTPYNSSHLPAAISVLYKPRLSEMFENIARWKFYADIAKYNTNDIPFTHGVYGLLPLATTPVIVPAYWKRFIGSSRYLRNGNPQDEVADGPPFEVLRDLDLSPVAPVTELHGTVGDFGGGQGSFSFSQQSGVNVVPLPASTFDEVGEDLTWDGMESNTMFDATDGANVANPGLKATFKPVMLDMPRRVKEFSLRFNPPMVVRYDAPGTDITSVDDGTSTAGAADHSAGNHSSYGMAKTGLSLCVVSTHTNNFWDLRVDCKVVFFDGGEV